MSSDACLELADFRDAWQVALRSVLDVMVFALMVAWLTFKAWQENKFFSATLDTDQDLNVSWHEIQHVHLQECGQHLEQSHRPASSHSSSRAPQPAPWMGQSAVPRSNNF
jgi:hypothetical protein